MRPRGYYSIRTGRHPEGIHYGLSILQRCMRSLYLEYEQKSWFHESFGYDCIDAYNGFVPGTLGSDIGASLFLALRKDLWPIEDNFMQYSEDDCFDMLEFLYDHVSRPVDGYNHTYNNCGWHYSDFDRAQGQGEFRERVNAILQDYGSGWQLSTEGEIVALADEGMQPLVEAEMAHVDPDNVEQRVQSAIRKFRARGSTDEDRRDAVRDLADVLEYLRIRAEQHFLTKKDSGDLFRIANQFAIRHHNDRQKGDYPISIWYRWIFYVYLATIHACVRAIKEGESPPSFSRDSGESKT